MKKIYIVFDQYNCPLKAFEGLLDAQNYSAKHRLSIIVEIPFKTKSI